MSAKNKHFLRNKKNVNTFLMKKYLIMHPASKNLEGHILLLGCLSIHPSIHLSRFLMHSITLETCMLLF